MKTGLHFVVTGIIALLIHTTQCTPRQQEEEQTSKLTIYPMESQNGTVANRRYFNAKGQVTKEIYYGKDHAVSSFGPITEETLIIREVPS